MIDKIKKLKKIELHLHLDGSVSLELASQLSGLSIDECKKKMQVSDDCESLTEYLEKFAFPISLMQTKENLKVIANDLVDRLERENVIYAEIKIAPMFHQKLGLTYDEIIESVLEGLNKNQNVKTNLILCMKRGLDKSANLEIISLTEKYLNNGVCAIDLVGDEATYKLTDYIDLFKIIKEKNIPFTIHAGEVDMVDLPLAIEIGAKRIGHGVKCIDSKELINLIKEKNILLEICPTSNIQTKAFDLMKNHPVYDLYKNSINISINTDNMTVSNIDLNKEYYNLINSFNFKISDLEKINKNTVNYTFLSSIEKVKLLEKLIDN